MGGSAELAMVHISMKQRSGKKCMTFVQGFPETACLPKSGKSYPVNFEKIVRTLKIEFQTGGKLVNDKKHGKIFQLQGDVRKEVAGFLVNETAIISKDQVRIHGA